MFLGGLFTFQVGKGGEAWEGQKLDPGMLLQLSPCTSVPCGQGI